jgi:hypothetical protein
VNTTSQGSDLRVSAKGESSMSILTDLDCVNDLEEVGVDTSVVLISALLEVPESEQGCFFPRIFYFYFLLETFNQDYSYQC